MFSFIFWEGTSNLDSNLVFNGLLVVIAVTVFTTLGIHLFDRTYPASEELNQ